MPLLFAVIARSPSTLVRINSATWQSRCNNIDCFASLAMTEPERIEKLQYRLLPQLYSIMISIYSPGFDNSEGYGCLFFTSPCYISLLKCLWGNNRLLVSSIYQRRSWLFSRGDILKRNATVSCSSHRGGVYTVKALGVSVWFI